MDKRIILLLSKFLDNNCSARELEEVYDIIKNGRNLAEWDVVIKNDVNKCLASSEETLLSIDKINGLHDRVLTNINHKPIQSISNRRKLSVFIGFAACFLLILLGISRFYVGSLHQSKLIQYDAEKNVVPGGNNARLRLASGKEIILNELPVGTLGIEKDIQITKTAEGLLVFKLPELPNINPIKETGYHTLSTPRGGQYRVILADGSSVWLNAESSLRFPATFSTEKREVYLDGEAYFEIAKAVNQNANAPFIVKTNLQEINVLGTKFNIMAYSDESTNKVSLVEGSVKIKNSLSEKIIKPGQIATTNTLTKIVDLKYGSVGDDIAWKDGFFSFRQEHIYTIMKKIARWYDVDVTYVGDMRGKTFTGTFSRFTNVQDALSILESTGVVKLKLTERRIVIMP